jgi:acetyl esterase/lipase
MLKMHDGMAQGDQEHVFIYTHDRKESFASKAMRFFLLLSGKKRSIERDMIRGKIRQRAAPIRSHVSRRCRVEVEEVAGRRVWTLQAKRNASTRVILYLHGGAYIYNMLNLHWHLIGELAKRTGAKVLVPDYPLAPLNSCLDTHAFMRALYRQLLEEHPSQEIRIMGDSAGAGLALAFIQQLRNENQPLPGHIILLSPWLDLSMENPRLEALEKCDRLLNIRGLQLAGASYAGDLDVKDFRVSPLFGDINGLPQISIFTGMRDILHVDARELRLRLESEGISGRYFEYPEMLHVWFIFPFLPEAGNCIHQIYEEICTTI